MVITVNDLNNAAVDTNTLAEVANSRVTGDGAAISETITRFGDTVNTVQGQLAKLGFQIPAVNWTAITSVTSNIQVYRFPAGTGDFYVAKVPVPFTTGVSFTTSNWQPLTVATADNIVDTFAGNGIQIEFTLSEIPSGEDNIQAFVDGIYKSPSLHTLLDDKITFATPPPSGISDNVVIITSKNVTVSESFAADAEASATAAAISAADAAEDAVQTASDLADVTALLGATGTGAIIDFGDRTTGSAIFDYGFRV
jgi:hypothetical protein